MALRAAFFDLDGTLVDSLAGIEFAVDHALAVVGVPVRTGDLRPLIGPPIRQIFQKLLPDCDEQQITQLEAAFRTCYDSAGWRKTVLHENAALVLEELQCAGVQVFLVTNKPALSTHRILEALNIRHLFQSVLCRDTRTPGFQSKAEMLEHLISVYRLERESCLYVGDTYEDYLAGLEARIPMAIVTHNERSDDNPHWGCAMLKNLVELLADNLESKEIA